MKNLKAATLLLLNLSISTNANFLTTSRNLVESIFNAPTRLITEANASSLTDLFNGINDTVQNSNSTELEKLEQIAAMLENATPGVETDTIDTDTTAGPSMSANPSSAPTTSKSPSISPSPSVAPSTSPVVSTVTSSSPSVVSVVTSSSPSVKDDPNPNNGSGYGAPGGEESDQGSKKRRMNPLAFIALAGAMAFGGAKFLQYRRRERMLKEREIVNASASADGNHPHLNELYYDNDII